MDARWYLAQSLEERLTLARENIDPGNRSASELAGKRLDRWKTGAFSDNLIFERFLRSINLSENEFKELLGQSKEQIQDATGKPLQWVDQVLECLSDCSSSESSSDFLALIDPLISYFRNKLQCHAHLVYYQFPSQADEPETLVALLTAGVTARLRRAVQKILILETNIARVENRLTGETSKERFESFIGRISTNEGRLSIYLEYPVLIRHVWRILEQWCAASCEFIDRFKSDYKLLDSQFGIGSTPITGIIGGAGDVHCQGRSVHVIEFANKKKLVYKPRSLAVDHVFGEMLQFLSDRGMKPDLKVPEVLDRGAYGWCEFIDYDECKTEIQITKFYERQGAWLALLYVLGTTDLHLENLVACGEHPVVIDLETLFHPETSAKEVESADDLVAEKLCDSVISVGLLPTPVRVGERSMDTSGIGAKPDQILPFDWEQVENPGSDEIHITTVPGRFGEIFSNPRLSGKIVDPAQYSKQIKKGFVATYRLLQDLKEELLGKDGWIERFSDLPVRVILRPTSYYANVRSASRHPHFNHRALDQDFITRDLWAQTSDDPSLEKTIASECRQLLAADIPYFKTTPNSKDITGGDGTLIVSVLTRSGREVAETRLQRMGEDDLGFQLWLIDAALQSMTLANTTVLQQRGIPRKCSDFLDAAIACGDHLVETAVTSSGQASWACLALGSGNDTGSECHRLAVTGEDLYGGSLGIALFLAYLCVLTGDERYRKIAAGCLNQARANQYAKLNAPGAYAGICGLIYVNMHMATLFKETDLEQRTDFVFDLLPDLIKNDSMLDLTYGCAGAIPVLLAYSKCVPGSRALELARACGDHLLQNASRGNRCDGLTWKSLQKPRGFSHGISGIAFALSELAAATNESKYLEAVAGALAEEADLLKDNRWTDSAENPQGVAWCHGAPGIALSRMKIYQNQNLPQAKEEAMKALDFLLASPAEEEHVMCHGALGNLEPLIVASEVFPHPIYGKQLRLRSRRILEEINRKGWQSKVASQLIEPGLMMGVAGIGFQLLRLHAPDKVPSVLTLQC